MTDYRYIEYERIGRVARIWLNRPQYRNALSRELQEELDDAFSVATYDEGVGAIILAGRGKMFSAGHDLGTPDQMSDLERRPKLAPELRGEYQFSFDTILNMALRWRDIPKPTIAQVHGLCIFGGWKVAAAMDIVIAGESARFLPGPPQWMSLPWDIGVRRAKAILLDDQTLTAAQAQELGFVYRVVPDDQLEAATLEVAQRIAERPPFLLQMTKAAVNQAQEAMGYRSGAQAALAYRALHHASGEQPKLKPGQKREVPSVARALAKGKGAIETPSGNE
jgi:enoyl-CoA hydratase